MTTNLVSEKTQEPFALIMKGGGAKGLAYLGAIQVLSKYYDFNWYVGTSAGAITAVLLAAGYSVDRLIEIIEGKNFNDFMDLRFRDLFHNLVIGRGIFSGYELQNWVEKTLNDELKLNQGDKNPIRLEQLHRKNTNRLTVFASTQYDPAKDYDSYKVTTKEKKAKWVVRASASIPFFFIRIYDEDGVVFDGGVSHNYPIKVFLEKYNKDEKLKYLGLYLGSKISETKNYSVVSNLLDRWLSGNDATGLREYEDQTVVIDPFPVTTLRFNLTNKEKEFLLATGRASALEYLLHKSNVEPKPSELEVEEALRIAEKLRAELIPPYNRRKWKRRIVAVFFILLFISAVYSIWSFIPSGKRYDYWTREKTVGGISPRVFHHEFNTLDECLKSENEFEPKRFVIDGFRCSDIKPTRQQLQKLCEQGDDKSCKIGNALDAEN